MMLESKFMIFKLPQEGDHATERRFFSEKGEMAQILNRNHESFHHLVYWDLDSPNSGQERGHHFHKQKVEFFYIISGELDLIMEDLDTNEKMSVPVEAGQRISIQPNIAHAFRSKRYSQVLEYSPHPYDPSDTYSFRIV